MSWKDILKNEDEEMDEPEIGQFSWGEAFSKYGFEDGYYSGYSYDVAQTLIDAGYEVYHMEITGHNERITAIYKDGKKVWNLLDYGSYPDNEADAVRNIPKEIEDILDKEYPNGLPKEKEVYDEKNPTREQVKQKYHLRNKR